MARPGYKKGAISQRERVSLVAELLLEGALRVMDSAGPKADPIETKRMSLEPPATLSRNDQSTRIQTNPRERIYPNE